MSNRFLATLLIVFASVFAPGLSAHADEAEFAKHSADVAYDALLHSFWDVKRGDFVGSGNYWFYAHSIDIAALAYARTPSTENLAKLRNLFDQQNKRGYLQGAHVFFDDENWMALSLARAATITNDPDYSQMAIALFDDVMTRGTEGRSDGVWWNIDHKKIVTASNAGPVVTALLLWKSTGEQRYFDFAVRTYAFWLREMAFEPSGQVYDALEANGTKDKTPFSYDQGLMIGAAVELYRTTRDPQYLDQARRFSKYMLDNMKSSSGVMLEQVCVPHRAECRGWKDVAQFKGIGFRYMVELAKEDPTNLELRAYLQTTAASLMSPSVFDSKLERFAYEWDGTESPAAGTYQTTNSAALALAAYATLF